MHTAVIQSPQEMSNGQSYRPRSPDLPGSTESQGKPQPPRLGRLPSYQIQEPSLPKGYSFSPRGSYDASPFFSQTPQQASNPWFTDPQRNSYPEQSPPRFPPASLLDQPQAFSPISYTESPQQPTNSFQHSSSPFSHLQHQPAITYQPSHEEMARLRSRKPVNYNDDHSGAQYEEQISTYQQPPPPMHHLPQQPQQFPQQPPPHHFMQQPMTFQSVPMPPQPHPQSTGPPMPPVDVKTKFPVARIKRIMQADEDVGKVAQATPTAVSKALELFMIALVTKGAVEAKNNGSKRVTATHLKHALLTDSQFDFLNEICEAVPDEGGKGSKGRAKSEAKSEESDEDIGAIPKKKSKGSRKKKAGDEEASE